MSVKSPPFWSNTGKLEILCPTNQEGLPFCQCWLSKNECPSRYFRFLRVNSSKPVTLQFSEGVGAEKASLVLAHARKSAFQNGFIEFCIAPYVSLHRVGNR
jgi:hypothetical protein